MTTFLRLLADRDKENNLLASCTTLRSGIADARVFEVMPDSFRALPGAPFAYWVSEAVRQLFQKLPPFHGNGTHAQHGGSSKDDFRFIRLYWETPINNGMWTPFSKGGSYSPFYADTPLVINWKDDARELEQALLKKYPYLGETADWVLHKECNYLSPGITWPRRPSVTGSFWILPAGCIFSENGPSAFVDGFDLQETLFLLALVNSTAFNSLTQLMFSRGGAGSGQTMTYEVGYVGKTPIPLVPPKQKTSLAKLARRAWSLKRTLDTVEETSHAFILPAALRERLGDYDPQAIEAELTRIQTEIDNAAFDLYGFNETDRAAVQSNLSVANEGDTESDSDDDGNDENNATPIDQIAGLLSWGVGVVFGQFDWRLATSERAAPCEPDPFDPLPAKSPGTLPHGVDPFHEHSGILVDEQGHPHDLARLIEEVLVHIEAHVPGDVRRWLQREFFAFHLQRYSKSRRKAPIYWPIATFSGSYTIWVHYPSLTSETLYSAINDFLEPKLKQVAADTAMLRNRGANRSREEEKQFETLQAFELELIELRDNLLNLAPTYKPNHDDGVQITAAPLWSLFRHKPWQKVLKETWTKLEKGDYDWAHLAMNYWPDRVREKCKTDKSLAIAHGLEQLYVEPKPQPKNPRGRKKPGGDE
jgi:hypothetical protein